MDEYIVTGEAVVNEEVFQSLIDTNLSRLVRVTSSGIITGMQTAFRLPKSGRFYRRPGGRIHRASAPGEPAARDSGRLEQEIEATFPAATLGLIRIPTPYAERLEFAMDRAFVRPSIAGVVSEMNRSNTVGFVN